MRFNEPELVRISQRGPCLEGVLNYMKPQADWGVYYQPSTFKERKFRLVQNLLFYYRLGEQDPTGVLILEQAHVAYEQQHPYTMFAFSLTFVDGKHIFACKCQDDVNKWVIALKQASYQCLRDQCHRLRLRIHQLQERSGHVTGGTTAVHHRPPPALPWPAFSNSLNVARSTFYSASTTTAISKTTAKPQLFEGGTRSTIEIGSNITTTPDMPTNAATNPSAKSVQNLIDL